MATKTDEWYEPVNRHEPGTFVVRDAEWRERRRELTEVVHRQRLLSASFGTVLPALDDIMESYVWVVIEETPSLTKAAKVLGIAHSTLWRWMDEWEERDKLK